MFASFDKAFNKNKSLDKIPEPIIKALSKRLPSGFKYVQIDKDTCGVMPEGEDMNFTFNFTRENEFDAKTPEELMEYLYRTQKQLEVHSKKVKVNGQEFDINDFIKQPLNNTRFDEENFSVIIKPQKFPEPFEILIGDGGKVSINVKVQREPYANLTKALFKSIDMESLKFTYLIDEMDKSMKIDLKMNLDKAKSVNEMIVVAKIYNSFKSGKIKIGNIIFNGSVKMKSDYSNIDEFIEFWEKVVKLSDELKILFEPKDIISREEVKTVNSMYESLVEHSDFEERVKTNVLTMTFNNKMESNELLYKDEMLLQFIEYREWIVLEQKIRLWCVTTLSEFKIEDILEVDETEFKVEVDETEFKYEIKINTLSDEGILKKIRFFKNKNDAELYREHFLDNKKVNSEL